MDHIIYLLLNESTQVVVVLLYDIFMDVFTCALPSRKVVNQPFTTRKQNHPRVLSNDHCPSRGPIVGAPEFADDLVAGDNEHHRHW